MLDFAEEVLKVAGYDGPLNESIDVTLNKLRIACIVCELTEMQEHVVIQMCKVFHTTMGKQ